MAKLTAAAVAKFKATTKRRVIRDDQSRSLFIVVYPSGARSFIMRFRKPNGAPAKLTLGPLDTSGKEQQGEPVIGQPLTLAAARQLAAAVLRERAKGSDVFGDHAAAKRRRLFEKAQAAATTFGALARQFVDEHARPKTRRWRETARVLGLRYPADAGTVIAVRGGLAERWDDRAVTAIDGHDIHAIVDEARRRGTPGRAVHTKGISDPRGRAMARTLSKFFAWLLQRRLITSNPCTGIFVPPAPAARERVLSDAEIRLVWLACDKLEDPFGPLIQLLLLSGQRLNEVSRMTRDELHEDGTWHLPGSRSKNRKSHLIPLPRLAIELFARVKPIENCPFTFSTTGRRPVSGWSKTKARLDAAMLVIAQKDDPKATITPWRLHDLRRSAATGMAKLGVSVPVIEKVLNHVSGSFGGIVAVYQRHTYEDEKRAALERWATHVQGLVNGKATNIVPMHKRKR